MTEFDYFDPKKLIPDPGFKAPDMLGAVEGWRVWQVPFKLAPYERPKLMSATFGGYYWHPRKFARAECSRCGDDLPGENCSCGFYSAKSFEHLMTMHYHQYDLSTGNGNVMVLGKLANWGKVIEGTQGWRSEKAYPVKLWVPFEASHLAAPLKEVYGVPVELKNILAGPAHVKPVFKAPNPNRRTT